ncbi:MAG TPA: hypothetical protein VFT78_12995 [Hanamia sp.]|nr:hypothetical protein [Hanamia sp.]
MSWLRMIEFFRQENALLKYRLSELVDSSEDSLFLQTAEYFQNEFLIKDEALKILIRQLQEYSDLIQSKVKISPQLIDTHNKIRNDILMFGKDYASLSKEFNEKMVQTNSN